MYYNEGEDRVLLADCASYHDDANVLTCER